jgi:hypothetical protein
MEFRLVFRRADHIGPLIFADRILDAFFRNSRISDRVGK